MKRERKKKGVGWGGGGGRKEGSSRGLKGLLMQIKLIFVLSLVLKASVFGTRKLPIVFWLQGTVIDDGKKKLSGSTGRNGVQSINC